MCWKPDGHDGAQRVLCEPNQPFSELAGYSEEDFQAAVWPPVMGRPNLPKHREQMELLLEGRIDSAVFNTGHVHAQGLLVPLAGTITLVEERARSLPASIEPRAS